MKGKNQATRRGTTVVRRDDPPLLRALISEAIRRGHTLAALARTLGVTYERLAQWRRHEFDMASAHRQVHEAAAAYLSVPVTYVLCLAGVVTLRDFVRPPAETLDVRIRSEMAAIRQDRERPAAPPCAALMAS